MKKITLISACMLLFTVANAEQMQFVTTLSAPVGNFAHLDAADSTHVTTAPILNFCNTRSNVGNIVIKGANAYLKQVNVQNGTALGSTNTPEYRLSEKLTVENGGTVNARRIMASNVTFKDTNFHQSNVTNTIYGNDIPVMGGKTDNMEISGTAKINKSAQNTANLGEELWWDNQYASDYDASGNKKTNGKTYTSFLLKSKTAGCSNPSGEANCVHTSGTWDSSSCECTCPSNMVLGKNGVCLGTFKPKILDANVLVECHYCPGDRQPYKLCSETTDPNEQCIYSRESDCQGSLSSAPSKESACISSLRVNSYEFFVGGYLSTGDKGGSGCTGMAIFWQGGTYIGGQLGRYSGRSMPNCYGTDYQAMCDKNCTPGSSSCSYKCVISKQDNGCNNGCYHCSNGWHTNSGTGTGKVLTCVANK
ncbi:hypothetical protein [Candidatus Avelusimicrobium sp.]|uniref:hypothetical protein n=1 Tax=Candidatus Avelusimicrobium sp. TaxID=3048833 RepID=UPI003D7F09EE